MSRPTKDQYFMQLAQLAATRSTCIKRSVGCVLVDARGHELGTGYNGVAAGMHHCNENVGRALGLGIVSDYPHACKGHDLPAGQDSCEAVHAEQNSLLKCRDPWALDTCYVTLSPCKPCLKLLMNTSCRRIVFAAEHDDPWPKEQWLKMGRIWEKAA